MPALPADALRATRPHRIVIREDTALKTLYPGARDGLTNPETGYFSNAADADLVLVKKAALIGTARQRFQVVIADEVWIDPLAGIPSYRLVDAELGVDRPVLLTRLEIDMETETTSMEVLG